MAKRRFNAASRPGPVPLLQFPASSPTFKYHDHQYRGRAMGQIAFIDILGIIALVAMAFTILIPLSTAMKKCWLEKRAKRRAKIREETIHAESAGHSLS